MRIAYEASEEARAGIAAVGRTEDLLFSPDRKRLAIAGFNDAKLLVLEVEAFEADGADYRLAFGRALTITSPTLNQPHGLAWIDDETLIVANRKGQVPVFRVPRQLNATEITAHPITTLGTSKADFINGPGSVAVRPVSDDLVEVTICNNYADNVSRHLIDRSRGLAVLSSEITMREGLRIPDGVVYSASGRRVAVSNHVEHTVLIYDTAELGRVDKPVGVLHGVAFPHGLRFTPDDRGMVVADAGAPFVHIFGSRDGEWRGAHQPLGMIEVIEPDAFVRGHINPEEGGPKGIALSPDGALLFVTCEEEPLVVFDIREQMKSLGLMPYGPEPAGMARSSVEDVFSASLMRARGSLEQALEAAAAAKARTVAADARIAATEVRITGAEAKASATEARAKAAESRVATAEAKAAAAEAKANAAETRARGAEQRARTAEQRTKTAGAKIAEGKTRLATARGKVAALEGKLAAAKDETKKLLGSASWRLTAPLRSIRDRLRGKR